jgi:hypothetical protein
MKLSQKMSVGRLRQNLYSSAFCHVTSAMKISLKMSNDMVINYAAILFSQARSEKEAIMSNLYLLGVCQ